jgi:hypothetical protein
VFVQGFSNFDLQVSSHLPVLWGAEAGHWPRGVRAQVRFLGFEVQAERNPFPIGHRLLDVLETLIFLNKRCGTEIQLAPRQGLVTLDNFDSLALAKSFTIRHHGVSWYTRG